MDANTKPTTPLRSLAGFPPLVADILAAAGVVTLADLEPHVRDTSITAAWFGPACQLREAMAGLGVGVADGLFGAIAAVLEVAEGGGA